MKRKSIFVFVAALLTACAESAAPPTAPATADVLTVAPSGPCYEGFVTITPGGQACGLAFDADSRLVMGDLHYQPIIASYEQGASGQVAIPAKKVILFPPAPQTHARIIQACETAEADGLCWATRLFNPHSDELREVVAGKYGPEHWIRWSPGEIHLALISRNEGAEWLHIVDTATGATTTYPDETENANWVIDRASFAWTGDDAFTVTVKTCETCAPEARSFTLP
jgi:hypothetical protein